MEPGITTQRLRQAIELQHARLQRQIPPDREQAILALLRARDRLCRPFTSEPLPDLITGLQVTDLGGNTALSLLVDDIDTGTGATSSPGIASNALDTWAERFLQACGELAGAGLVLSHVETGFMKLVDDGPGTFSAWIATKAPPASWRERADIDWWASSLARQHEPELDALRSRIANGFGDDEAYLQLAHAYLKTMTYQFGYPPTVVLGDLRVETWLDILAGLIAWALPAHDRGDMPTPVPADALVAALAATLAIPPDIVREALAAFTLDGRNAAWHAAVPGVAAAPLVRLAGDRLVPSLHGLTTDPLLFLARELRRRDPQGYHNAAQYREAVFRQDLYALFEDKRFVTSPGTIRLRHGKGDLRTDIDAVVFDRKTGTLGLFELKSQDPFARSTAALTRQRDNVLYANRQVSGVLDWIRRYGANELLGRVDAPTAKRFRANKIYPFVLGRYLAHFRDGAVPDPRAAWGTWPDVLRLLDEQPLRPIDANPIASLFTRLQRRDFSISLATDTPPRKIVLGDIRLIVYASYQAHRALAGDA